MLGDIAWWRGASI